MKYLITLLIYIVVPLLFISCESKVEKSRLEVETETQKQKVEVTSKDITCDILIISGNPPLALWKMKNGQQLALCDVGGSTKLSENSFSGWVNLFAVPTKLEDRFISQVDSELPSSILTYKVEKISNEEIIITKNLLSSGDIDTEISKKIIECKSDICVQGSEVCTLKKSRSSIDSEIVEYVRKISEGSESNLEKYGYYDLVIDKLITSAIHGSKQAKKLILETDKRALKVDGHSGEALTKGKQLLKLLEEIDC